MSDNLRVGVLFGGKSSEKEISLATGRYIYQLLDQSQFQGLPLFIDQKGQLWQVPDKLVIQNTTKDIEARLGKEATKLPWEDLKGKVEVVFNSLLGKYGEDGCIQGLLEILGVPYTGSGILASAVSMDKKVTRELLKYKGFLVPKGFVVSDPVWRSKVKSQKSKIQVKIQNEIGYPCVIKPTREGSSVGVVVSHKEEELKKVMEQALYFDREVLVEEYIKGKEFMCVVWGNDKPQAMLPTEVEFEGEIHTYESKYMPGGSQYFTPIRIAKKLIAEIQKQAVEIYSLLGMKGYGRIDGFARGETIYISEIHTGTIMVPSSYVFHEVSRTKVELKGKSSLIPMTPKMWVVKIVEMAIEAHKNKKGLL
ncbi:D-alanine--D-alanine ligase [Candidatus Gottesmanbacteria bacterium]|nr:D-alanine--D-alanine ligase [Candidatus Gottesmanbacteria bacterium]